MLLIDEFLRKMQGSASRVMAKHSDYLLESGISAMVSAIHAAETIYFAPSTMAMLTEKLAHYQKTVEEVQRLFMSGTTVEALSVRAIGSYQGAWIEFDKPITLGPLAFSAMFSYVPSHYLQTGRDQFHLYLIDQFAEIRYILVAGQDMHWQLEMPSHPRFCPLRQCKVEYGVLIPCDLCRQVLSNWSRIYGLSMIIAGQYLAARRYEEKTFTGVRRISREHNAKKTRAIQVKHIFKVIDANEIIIPVIPEDAAVIHEHRGSWLLAAKAEGDLDYQERHTRPFLRTYRHPRYVNMQGKTVDFPEGITRMQPVRKSLQGKRVKKVKASQYEQ